MIFRRGIHLLPTHYGYTIAGKLPDQECSNTPISSYSIATLNISLQDKPSVENLLKEDDKLGVVDNIGISEKDEDIKKQENSCLGAATAKVGLPGRTRFSSILKRFRLKSYGNRIVGFKQNQDRSLELGIISGEEKCGESLVYRSSACASQVAHRKSFSKR